MRVPTVEVTGLTKHYGPTVAVDGLSFEVPPGRVTGFLGPNGAGKTTTLRCLLGLVHPTSGTATFSGRTYRELAEPLRTVGAVLEGANFHPGRSARAHLRFLCAAGGLPPGRADEVLELVGLQAHAVRRVESYSLGMRQRLALAAALLGDPGVLLLDEPANGLDPEGIRWLRGFLRAFAASGRVVLVSSHVLSEVAQTVDHVVVIDRGRLVTDAPLGELLGRGAVRVRSPRAAELARLLQDRGAGVDAGHDGALVVTGMGAAEIGELAAVAGIALHELTPEASRLEDTFLRLVGAGE